MKLFRWIGDHILETVSGAAFVIMISVVFLNVILRFTTGRSLVWSEEVAAIGFIWTIFMGAAVCCKERGGLISVDILINLFPSKINKTATLIIDIAQVAICVVMCVLGWKFAMSAANKVSLSLQLPYTVYDIPIAISFAFMTYYTAKRVAEDLKAFKTVPAENEGENVE
ncbi:TRAP transporter small permease [Oscillibacter sp. GMB15532]|uniref:TRAP transporter small permease n=1 Tax=Oscillibacter sp. GMB15532 TaxID=3230022 RepID=UPI0034DF8980